MNAELSLVPPPDVSWFLEVIQTDGYAAGRFCEFGIVEVTHKAPSGTSPETHRERLAEKV